MFIAYNPCNDAFKLNELINHFLHAHNKKGTKGHAKWFTSKYTQTKS